MKLCVQRGAPQVIPPMLLAGPPGLGKTHFAKAFAQELGAAFYIIGFDAEHKSAVLLGQDKGWAAATPGVVYEAVVNGDCANPVILLDEIDKARGTGSHYQSPLSSLHSLLEPVSNKTVTDISVGLTFDASLVSWICTCNYLDLVPSTLLSRMKVFHIKHPTDAALAIRMARVMLEKTHELIDLPNFEAPSPKLAPLIAHLSPREQRQELEHAYAIAVASGRRALRIEDFAHLETDDAPAKPKQHLH
jgi:ATP-dependent Lon protease